MVDWKNKIKWFFYCLVVDCCYCVFLIKLSYVGVYKKIKGKVRSVWFWNFIYRIMVLLGIFFNFWNKFILLIFIFNVLNI